MFVYASLAHCLRHRIALASGPKRPKAVVAPAMRCRYAPIRARYVKNGAEFECSMALTLIISRHTTDDITTRRQPEAALGGNEARAI